MGKHLLDFAVIIWLIAPLIIISVKHYEDKTVPMRLFVMVLIFEIWFQKMIILQNGEWLLPNIIIHIFFIWPLTIAFYAKRRHHDIKGIGRFHEANEPSWTLYCHCPYPDLCVHRTVYCT